MFLPRVVKDASERPERRVVGRKIMDKDLQGTAFGSSQVSTITHTQPFLSHIRQGTEVCKTEEIKPGGAIVMQWSKV